MSFYFIFISPFLLDYSKNLEAASLASHLGSWCERIFVVLLEILA